MKERTLARRYGKGLFLSASETGEIAKLDQDLMTLKQMITRAPLVLRSLRDEGVPLKQREQLIDALQRMGGFCSLVRNLLRLLLRKRRTGLLPLIIEDAGLRIKRSQEQVMATITLADAAFASELSAHVHTFLSSSLKKMVECEIKTDASLIGGFVVQVGDVRYDASIAGELRQMKMQLLAEAV